MQAVFDHVHRFAIEHPDHTALADGQIELNYRQLEQQIQDVADILRFNRIGLLLANNCAWAVLDLAAQYSDATCIPIPSFFSDGQLRHLIADAAPEVIITDQPSRMLGLVDASQTTTITVAGKHLVCLVLTAKKIRVQPQAIAKITYTSGTTGQPKGVCLSNEVMERVTVALSTAVNADTEDRAISLLPLSTLLANIAGIYAPLHNGGTACVPDLADCGMSGSTAVHADLLIAALQRYQPTVTVLVPFLLKLLVEAAAQDANLPSSLRYIAVGGAPVAPLLIERARALGLSVYQGYGLSEAASVVSMNAPGKDRVESVGQPLPHVKIRIAADSEIMVSGNLFNGYLGQDSRGDEEWATGDTGFIDDDGYLYISGRKKTSFATAHGRKLAPEWIESELIGIPAIAQAALFGEARRFNIAVIVPNGAAAVPSIAPAVAALNQALPDYARVERWIIANEPFSPHNGLANSAGAIKRQAIAVRYADQIEQLYETEKFHAVL